MKSKIKKQMIFCFALTLIVTFLSSCGEGLPADTTKEITSTTGETTTPVPDNSKSVKDILHEMYVNKITFEEFASKYPKYRKTYENVENTFLCVSEELTGAVFYFSDRNDENICRLDGLDIDAGIMFPDCIGMNGVQLVNYGFEKFTEIEFFYYSGEFKYYVCIGYDGTLTGITAVSVMLSSESVETVSDFSDYDSILNMYFKIVELVHNSDPDKLFDRTYVPNFNIASETEYDWYRRLMSAVYFNHQTYISGFKPVFGYALKDLNGNGDDELVLLLDKYTVLAVFSMCDGKPVLLEAADSRYHCAIDADGKIYSFGIGGADYSSYFIFEISNNGELVTIVEFGRDGHDSGTLESFYYKMIDGEKTRIGEAEANSLFDIFYDDYSENTTKNSGLEFIPITDKKEVYTLTVTADCYVRTSTVISDTNHIKLPDGARVVLRKGSTVRLLQWNSIYGGEYTSGGSKRSDWYKIEYDGEICYVTADSFKRSCAWVSEEEYEAPKNVIVNADFSDYDSILTVYRKIVEICAGYYGDYDSVFYISYGDSRTVLYNLIDAVDYNSDNNSIHGYALIDINNDGVDELVLMKENNTVLAVFTMHNGKAMFLNSADYRYSLIIGSNGNIQGIGNYGTVVACNIFEIPNGGGYLNTIFQFGWDGINPKTLEDLYYKFVDGKQVYISEEEFNSLKEIYSGNYFEENTDYEFIPLFDTDALDAYESVLKNETMLFDVDLKKYVYLKDCIFAYSLITVAKTQGVVFTVFDYDGNFAVLISNDSNGDGDKFVLYYYDGVVYCHSFTFRNMYYLMEDGSFAWNGAGSYGGGKLSISDGEIKWETLYEIINDGEEDAEYYIGGIAVTQAEMIAYTKTLSTEKVNWYELSSGNINKYLK